MGEIDWTPIINVMIPGVAALLAILLTWLSTRLASLLKVKQDGAAEQTEATRLQNEASRLQIEEMLRGLLSASLTAYLRQGLANGVNDPVTFAASAAIANNPGMAQSLGITQEKAERRAAALMATMHEVVS
ncbi:hypothetical protein ACRC7T_04015 [Segnochrobactraceae bacterium EtOH-i3]